MKNNIIKEFLNHLEEVISESNTIIQSSANKDLSGEPINQIVSVLSRQRAVIERICDKNSPYFKQMKIILLEYSWEGDKVVKILGILEALKNDIEKGYLYNYSELVHGEVFSDYLEMSQHLLDEGYKDPAAVLVGSSLEVHLRNLCVKNGIEITFETKKGIRRKNADRLNADLHKAVVYNALDHKSITAYLDLRNKAAHGEYEKFTSQQVLNMLSGVREVINRIPA